MAIVQLQNKRISADGTYTLAKGNGNASTLVVSGTFGAAVIRPGYINLDDLFIAFKDDTETEISFTTNFQIVQDGGGWIDRGEGDHPV